MWGRTTSEDKGYVSQCIDPFWHPFPMAGDKDVLFLVWGGVGEGDAFLMGKFMACF